MIVCANQNYEMKEEYAYIRTGEEITLVRCRGGAQLVLPDMIEGLPVTALADHIFAPEGSRKYPAGRVRFTGAAEGPGTAGTDVLRDAVGEPGDAAGKQKEGESIGEVREIYRPDAEAACGSAIEEIILPRHLRDIGSYAFYGCRSLKRIIFPAGLERLGSGIFTACNHLEELRFIFDAGDSMSSAGHSIPDAGHSMPGTSHSMLGTGHSMPGASRSMPGAGQGNPVAGRNLPDASRRISGDGYSIPDASRSIPEDSRNFPGELGAVPTPVCLREILGEIDYEVLISAAAEGSCRIGPHGGNRGIWEEREQGQPERGQQEQELWQLLFPGYYEDSIENTPARIIEIKFEGTGYAYRQCFREGHLDMAEYDKLFYLASVQENPSTAVRLALSRVAVPAGLEAKAREEYLQFLRREHAACADCVIASPDRIDYLIMLCRQKYFNRELLDYWEARMIAVKDRQALSVLADYRRKEFPVQKKCYSFDE